MIYDDQIYQTVIFMSSFIVWRAYACLSHREVETDGFFYWFLFYVQTQTAINHAFSNTS